MEDTFVDEYFGDDFFEDVAKESNLSTILEKKVVENFKKCFAHIFENMFLHVEFDHKTESVNLRAYLEVNQGEVEYTKIEPLSQTFEFGSFFDDISDDPEYARKAGEFFKGISDRCFEIEKEELENA